ncbi:DUF2157 domain-containing protein [Pelagibius sp. Alg239-R121]|uniref:DUF2157 domain-containing protein n=1 Tax=Pelagibius sp. Alg239-R121 TaxID=2993448 RepID=UPI0024A7921D|nr:DUF2157 domain-containing protein [Pelagibius sp. Alg239-R121]
MEQTPDSPLAQIPANRRLVDELHAHGKISPEAKVYALDFLYPADQWGLWISRLFLAVGTALVLSGVVYFFAFNWAKIEPIIKLASLQLAMLLCLGGAYYYKLERISGQILLLSASVLTGVFMAVFGQIYQTGADAYQLFMMWSVLTFGWTVISNFAAQWVFWLAITNIFLVLWWDQAALPEPDMAGMIFFFVMLLNTVALVLREVYLNWKKAEWLDRRWVRLLIVLAVLVPATWPVVMLIFETVSDSFSMKLSAATGLVGLGGLYALYRFKVRDMWSLAAIALFLCIVLEAAAVRLLGEALQGAEIAMFLLMGLATIGIFSAAVIYLRRVIAIIEADHV